jgi:hypothetical protein
VETAHFGEETLVGHGEIPVFYGEDCRLPAVIDEVLAELHHTLHTAAACGRPVIGDYKDFLHEVADGYRVESGFTAAARE